MHIKIAIFLLCLTTTYHKGNAQYRYTNSNFFTVVEYSINLYYGSSVGEVTSEELLVILINLM